MSLNLHRLVIYVEKALIPLADREIKQGGFKGYSEFFRHIIALGIHQYRRNLKAAVQK